MAENLMSGLIQEMNRAREVLKMYEEIGPAGMFGCTVITQTIKETEQAITESDVVKMLLSYQKLKEIK